MSSTRPAYSLSRERGWCANRIIFLMADSAMHSPICCTFSAVILMFSFVILTWFWGFIFYTSRFSEQLRCSIAISAGSGEYRSGGNRANSEWSVQMSTRSIVSFQYTKNIALGYRKTSYCYLALLLLFHSSAIIFHVDNCESYATLDTPKGEKSGTKAKLFFLIWIYTTFPFKHIEKKHVLCYN